MSFKPRTPNRLIAATALILAAGSLGACGFKPLYGQNDASAEASSAHIQTQLASITVNNIPNRVGQMMRTALKRRLAPHGQQANAYELQVSLTESLSTLAVEQNAFATRANLSVIANYKLVRVSDHQEMTSAAPRQVASYNILTSDYATLSAKEDARERAVQALADTIRNRLAIYFDGPGKVAAQPQKPTQPYSPR